MQAEDFTANLQLECCIGMSILEQGSRSAEQLSSRSIHMCRFVQYPRSQCRNGKSIAQPISNDEMATATKQGLHINLYSLRVATLSRQIKSFQEQGGATC